MAEKFFAEMVSLAETTSENVFGRDFIKRSYCSLSIEPIQIISSGQILTGSETDYAIAPNTLTIDSYSPGFEDSDHNDIGFDVEF